MKYLLIFLILLTTQISMAFEFGEVARFRKATLETIDKAQQNGITEIQGVQLSDLRNFVKTAPIYYSEHITIRVGGRRCAAWQPAVQAQDANGNVDTTKPYILLNKQCTDLSDEDLGTLGVHESMGLYGGLDRNYEGTSEILTGHELDSKLINFSLQTEQLKAINLQRELSTGGGSTGVGGGGDFDDINFKAQGLKYLESMPGGYVDGIPVALLEAALRQMTIVPATNTNGLMEYHGRGFGMPKSTVYVSDGIYRTRDYNHLGVVAYLAARVFLLHSPDEVGLTLSQSPRSRDLLNWEAPALQQAVLLFPSEDGRSIVTWRNSALQKTMAPADYQALLQSEQLRVQAILQNPEYQKMFQDDASHILIVPGQ